MPDKDNTSQQMPPAVPGFAGSNGGTKVKQPLTEKERAELQLNKLKSESHEDRAKRRSSEQQVLVDNHMTTVKEIQARWPVPRKPFQELNVAEQLRWKNKRKEIDEANRRYHLAVRNICAQHRAEDTTLARLAAEAAKAKEAA